jgi:RNA polymerase sigma-70 factor (ECF subfamily)
MPPKNETLFRRSWTSSDPTFDPYNQSLETGDLKTDVSNPGSAHPKPSDLEKTVNPTAPNSVLEVGETVRSTHAGDGHVDFDVVAAEHRPFLMQIAVASTRNVDDAEDIVQEALLRAYKGIGNFRGDCPIRAWLARIVVRVSINHRRSFVRLVKRWTLFGDLEREDADGHRAAFDAPDPKAKVDRETMIDVGRHVEKLPDEFRVPLLMLAVDGMTIPEIATILEIPEGTVKSRIFYGRKRLKKGLKHRI